MRIVKRLLKFFKKVLKKKRRISRKRPRTQSGRSRISRPSRRAVKYESPIARVRSASPAPKTPKPTFKKKDLIKRNAPTGRPIPESRILVGDVTHFFSRIQVGVVKISGSGMKLGDRILILGKKNLFYQVVKSLQIESVNVPRVHRGQLVGLRLEQPAKEGDKVFKVSV